MTFLVSSSRRPALRQSVWMLAIVATMLVAGIAARTVELPDGLHGCQIDAADRDECLRDTLERSLRVLSTGGAPALSIPPLDPLVRNATMYEYRRGPLTVTMAARNTQIYGLSRAKIHALRSDIRPDGMSVEVDMFFPRLFMTSAYKADSSYEALRFQSNGVMNITFTGMKVTHKIGGHFDVRDDEIYLQLDRYDMDVEKLADFKMQATGMFPDAELNQMAVTFANTYWRSMYQTVVPLTRMSWEPLILRECNQFLANVPFAAMLYYSDNGN